MNDSVAEKLAQKVTNMIEEVTDVNLLVRRLPPPQETINKIHERIDAMHASVRETTAHLKTQEKAIKENEAAIKANEAAMKDLEKQVKTIVEGQNKASADLGNALQTIKYYADQMRESIPKLQQETAQRLEEVKEKQVSLSFNVRFFSILAGILIVGMLLLLYKISNSH